MQKAILIIAIIMFIVNLPSINAQTKTEKIDKESTTHTQNNKIDSETSITRSKEAYKFEANFVASKNEGVKEMILQSLGEEYLETDGNRYEWKRSISGKEIFYGYFEKGKLELKLNKEIAPSDFATKINILGDDLRDLITAHDPSRDPYLKRNIGKKVESKVQYQVELKKAEKELEKAQQKLDRLRQKGQN